jgi:hypothetical protein
VQVGQPVQLGQSPGLAPLPQILVQQPSQAGQFWATAPAAPGQVFVQVPTLELELELELEELSLLSLLSLELELSVLSELSELPDRLDVSEELPGALLGGALLGGALEEAAELETGIA